MSEKEKNLKVWGTPQLILAALVLVLVIGVLTLSILWQINEFSLKLTMNGPQEITIEYGSPYEELGAEAIFRGTVFNQDPSRIEYTTTGQVDETTVGTYHIDYTVRHTVNYAFGELVFTDYARRTVHIVDTAAPEITLTADPETFTLPGQPYEEEGFAAFDNYDGDLTDKVTREEKDGVVIYKVSDSSGNTAETERVIVYNDPVPPELVLLGEATMSIKLGTAYTEPGYTATDNCDGDITALVTVTGYVDTQKVGTYTLIYTVQDTYENEVSLTRTVEVLDPNPKPQEPTKPDEDEKEEEVKIYPENPVGGVIYLTFDDGPGRHTARLLDILKQYNVKASFFLVNNGYYSTITRMAQEGHTVAIHSTTHAFKEIYASEEAYFADLEKMQSIIETHTGNKPMLVRFPGGSSNTISKFNPGIMTRLAALLEEKGYTYFDWNVDSNDAGGTKTATGVFNNVVKGVANKKASVVLMHDIKGYTVDAVADIINWGLSNGYTFEALTASSPTCHHKIVN